MEAQEKNDVFNQIIENDLYNFITYLNNSENIELSTIRNISSILYNKGISHYLVNGYIYL